MCLIGYNPFGNRLSQSLMRVAYDNNPDGLGIVWLDDDNELSVVKDVTDFKTFWSLLKDLDGYTYAFHLRYKTRGQITPEQCHPFQVLNREKHGVDLYMMHNGTIFGLEEKNKSDSQIFADILQEMYEKNFMGECFTTENLIKFYNFIEGGKTTIGSFNRLLFLTNQTVKIVNKSDGIRHNDIWYSNYYSFIKGYRKHQKEVKRHSFSSVSIVEDYG